MHLKFSTNRTIARTGKIPIKINLFGYQRLSQIISDNKDDITNFRNTQRTEINVLLKVNQFAFWPFLITRFNTKMNNNFFKYF